MKIGNTSYNVDAVKQMGFEKFKTKYPENAKEVYEKITGEKIIENGENIKFCETVTKEFPKRKKKRYENSEHDATNEGVSDEQGMANESTPTE